MADAMHSRSSRFARTSSLQPRDERCAWLIPESRLWPFAEPCESHGNPEPGRVSKMKDHYAIRLSRLEDARAIAGVLQAAFEEYKSRYTPKGYCATTPNEGEILRRVDQGPTWVATYEEEIVGTVSVVPKNDSLYVRSMAILPAARD